MKYVKVNGFWTVALMVASIGFMAASCSEDEAPDQQGKVKMYITDAPIDDANVEAVVISISKIEMNGPKGWTTVKEFATPFSVNVLDYQNGASYFISEETVVAGDYTQARFTLNATTTSNGTESSPPSFIRFKDGTKKALFLNGDSQEGYTTIGAVNVVANSTTDVTLDFDARRSVTESNSGKFMVKPAIRIIDTKNAAKIEGSFTDYSKFSKVVAYLYEKGKYTAGEANVSADGEARFKNSVTSAAVDVTGNFNMALVNTGKYDIVLVSNSSDGEFNEVLGLYSSDATISPGATVEVNLSLSVLAKVGG